jgi:hypothetical protein
MTAIYAEFQCRRCGKVSPGHRHSRICLVLALAKAAARLAMDGLDLCMASL